MHDILDGCECFVCGNLCIFTCFSQDLKPNKFSKTQGLRRKVRFSDTGLERSPEQQKFSFLCVCVFLECVHVCVHGKSVLEGPVVCVNPLKDCVSLEIVDQWISAPA